MGVAMTNAAAAVMVEQGSSTLRSDDDWVSTNRGAHFAPNRQQNLCLI
jgi:hypothetical protein